MKVQALTSNWLGILYRLILSDGVQPCLILRLYGRPRYSAGIKILLCYGEVYQTWPLGYWSSLPSIKTWGGVSRSVSYCYWGSWRCKELSSRHQRVCFYPQIVKNGKTNNQLWKIAKLKKITFWSAFFGLVGLNWGYCSKITQGWGGVTHGGSAMGPNWAKWWFWPPPMKINEKKWKKNEFFSDFLT